MNATTADPLDEVLTDDEDALRELAVLRLKKRRDVKTHVAVYVLVNSVIWGIWLLIGVTSAEGTGGRGRSSRPSAGASALR